MTKLMPDEGTEESAFVGEQETEAWLISARPTTVGSMAWENDLETTTVPLSGWGINEL